MLHPVSGFRLMNGRMEDKPIRRAINVRLRLLVERLLAFSSSGRRLIAAAALLHVALAVGLFWVGRAQIAPRLLNRDAIMIVSDSYDYQSRAVRLAGILKTDGLRAWAGEPEPTHVKLISIQFAIFSPLFGYSALSAEPFNLFCYVAILSLVLMLGREVGGRRVGLLAAGIVALWPTFLLHTTQLLKDPLFIAAALALILIVTTWLTRTYSWFDALSMGAFMAVTAGVLLLIRVKFGVIIFAIVFFGFALLIIRQLIEKRLLYWNLICPVLILCVGALLPFYLTVANQKLKQYPSGQSGQHKSVVGPGRQVPGVVLYKSPAASKSKMPLSYARRLYALTDLAALKIGTARYQFNVSWPESGSGIDRNVEYKNLKDLILYLPRAFAIGFWAPFPDMWFGEGKSVGQAGRILSGAETFTMYLCQLLALVAIWRAPRCLPAWLLLLITTFGVTMLGLVVSNVGTLYRFRYLFWILLIILGAKGFESIVTMLRVGTSSSPKQGSELKEGS
jgi:4-amino-4-deoxy-L-arabinose transferase-like glycosyltransferase